MTGEQETKPAFARSRSNAGLGMYIETGTVSYFLESEPRKMYAQEFGGLLIADGCMVLTQGDGRSVTHSLSDVSEVIIRPVNSSRKPSNSDRLKNPESQRP